MKSISYRSPFFTLSYQRFDDYQRTISLRKIRRKHTLRLKLKLKFKFVIFITAKIFVQSLQIFNFEFKKYKFLSATAKWGDNGTDDGCACSDAWKHVINTKDLSSLCPNFLHHQPRSTNHKNTWVSFTIIWNYIRKRLSLNRVKFHKSWSKRRKPAKSIATSAIIWNYTAHFLISSEEPYLNSQPIPRLQIKRRYREYKC